MKKVLYLNNSSSKDAKLQCFEKIRFSD